MINGLFNGRLTNKQPFYTQIYWTTPKGDICVMAALFAIYFICLLLIYWRKRNAVFTLVIINLMLCFLMLLHHATDVLKIRL